MNVQIVSALYLLNRSMDFCSIGWCSVSLPSVAVSAGGVGGLGPRVGEPQATGAAAPRRGGVHRAAREGHVGAGR